MAVTQVYLFCNYTSARTRIQLQLSDLKYDNWLRKQLGIPALKYIDAAPWIEAFIRFFQENKSYHLHVIALQMGMKKEHESFDKDRVSYHYIKSGLSLWSKVSDKLFNIQKKNDFLIYQRRFAKALRGIKPDIVLMCGAENPDYATAFLNIECQHKLVIMQTLMNDEKRIQMGVSNAYRREIEDRVLSHCHHFAVPDVNWIQYVKQVNPAAACYPFTFPTIEPIVDKETRKQYDFVFFAGILGRNKGTNDVVSALGIVAKKFPNVTLNIIGGADKEYMAELYRQIKDERIEKNIIMTPSFPVREEVFKQVAKSNYAVLPGITASLNSTVREALLLGMPTIAYKTPDTIKINQESQCILTAKMEDIEDLAAKMEFAIINSKAMNGIGENGEKYAKAHFSQRAFNNSFSDMLRKVCE